mgnify:CR=1 FL=1
MTGLLDILSVNIKDQESDATLELALSGRLREAFGHAIPVIILTGGRGLGVKDATEWLWLELANPL